MKLFSPVRWLSAFAIAAPAIVLGQAASTDQPRLTPDDIAALPSIEAGAGTSGVSGIRTRILSGDPKSEGLYTIALQVPANTHIAAHRHRDQRSSIVVAGIWYFGFGATADDAAEKALGPGSFYVEPPNVSHFARTGSEPVTVYITGYGPTDTRYSDENSAPR